MNFDLGRTIAPGCERHNVSTKLSRITYVHLGIEAKSPCTSLNAQFIQKISVRDGYI